MRRTRGNARAEPRAGGCALAPDPRLAVSTPSREPSLPFSIQAVSYVSRRRMDAADFDPDEVDEEGLPLVYNEERISAFWSARLGELASRWGSFAAISAPWLTRLVSSVVRGTMEQDRGSLARDAVDNLEKLGPTCVFGERRERGEQGGQRREGWGPPAAHFGGRPLETQLSCTALHARSRPTSRLLDVC